MENERCDKDEKLFNARVNEDEIIIKVFEYKTLVKEKLELITKLDECKKENYKLKLGIINFFKILGDRNG